MATVTEICNLVNNCESKISDEKFKHYVLQLLCSNTAPQIRYDWEYLCDPANNNAPVAVRYQYLTDGSSVSVAAFNVDGTPFGGPVSSLIACGTQRDYEFIEELVCDSGVTLHQIIPVIDGVRQTAFYIDATGGVILPSGGPLSLGACPTASEDVETYPICDNGIQKIAEVRYSNGSRISVTYYLLDGTVTTTPVVWAGVSFGECVVAAPAVNNTWRFVEITGTNTFDKAVDAPNAKALTITIESPNVSIQDGLATSIVTATGSFSWGTQDNNTSVIGSLIFTGQSPTSKFYIHWVE